jgi:hypothetical protein
MKGGKDLHLSVEARMLGHKLAAFNDSDFEDDPAEALARELEGIKLSQLTLKNVNNNRDILSVSSKLAKAFEEIQTHLKVQNYYN